MPNHGHGGGRGPTPSNPVQGQCSDFTPRVLTLYVLHALSLLFLFEKTQNLFKKKKIRCQMVPKSSLKVMK